jgi:hypothetical protein
LRRKWNKCLVDEDPNVYEVLPDGTVRRGLRFLYGEEDLDMIRQGYKCSECGELQESAFPDACLLCGFAMKERQSEHFAERFAGDRETGGMIDWDAEEELLERQRFERNQKLGLTSSGIWVPGRD